MTAARLPTSGAIRLAAAAVAALSLAAGGAVARSSAAGPCGALAGAAHPHATHVLWIWLENHAYDQVIGSAAAPYENGLARRCGLAASYYAVAHPSLPNYIAATSGGTQHVTSDVLPADAPLSARSIFELVGDAGSTWRSYAESMPAPCTLVNAGQYAVKHVPAAYYLPLRSRCGTSIVPLGTLAGGALVHDLASPTRLPAFAFVTPNLCDDAHDCPVGTADRWLASWVPRIVASPAYRAGKLVVFLTYDEDDSHADQRVATIVLSETTRPGTVSRTRFDHYSLLRTSEEILGLKPLLGRAATARSMRAAFHL